MSIHPLDEHIMELQEINAGLVEKLQHVRRLLALAERDALTADATITAMPTAGHYGTSTRLVPQAHGCGCEYDSFCPPPSR